jgi:hypothetical protein
MCILEGIKMNGDLNTYFWITLENLNSFFNKKPSIIKDFLPVFAALTGVVFGFFLNVFNERRKTEKQIELFRRVFIDEIEMVYDDMKSFIPKAYNILDTVFTDRYARPMVYLPEISSIGFKEFYPKIIHTFTKDERRDIRLIIDKIKELSPLVKYFDGDEKKEPGVVDFMNKAVALSGCSVILYTHCQKFLKENHHENKTVSQVLAELNIVSKFHDGFIKHPINDQSRI